MHRLIRIATGFALTTDIAMALHTFLSTTVRHGHGFDLGIDTVMQRLWPGDVRCPSGTTRGRRKEVRAALEEIGCLGGWTVTFRASKTGKEHVARVERQRESASVGEKPSSRFIDNEMAAFRQQKKLDNTSADAPSRRVDLSGLFSIRRG